MRTQEDLLRAIVNAKLRRSREYQHALRCSFAAAQGSFPDDPIAQHRAAAATASRAQRAAESVASSPQDIQATMDEALQEAFPGMGFSWVETQISSHYVIARGSDGKLYAIAHAIADGGGVRWGEPQEFSGTLDSHDALLNAFGDAGGDASSVVEAQPPHVIVKDGSGKLYQIGHDAKNGVVNFGHPQEFRGKLRKG